MNPRFSRFAFTFGLLAAVAFLPARASAQSGADRVTVSAVVQSTLDHKAAAKNAAEEKDQMKEAKTEERGLTITINGKPKSPETRTGKWTIYGHKLGKGEHGLSVIESGDFTINLPGGVPQKVETKKVAFTFTPEHSEGGGKKAKRVEASGTRYFGYTIEVKDGETVVGEAADPTTIKAELK